MDEDGKEEVEIYRRIVHRLCALYWDILELNYNCSRNGHGLHAKSIGVTMNEDEVENIIEEKGE